MPRTHIVADGDCVVSIAEESGHFWETIWEDAANTALKEQREDHNVLLEGDRVVVPDKVPKDEERPCDQRHRFRRRGVPAVLRLTILDCDEPVSDAPYTLDIDGAMSEGRTDGEGRIEIYIPCQAKKGHLVVTDEERVFEYDLDLGHLDPVTEIVGVKQRLLNLGIDPGPINKETGAAFADALRYFQAEYGLEPTGAVDEATEDKLKALFGS